MLRSRSSTISRRVSSPNAMVSPDAVAVRLAGAGAYTGGGCDGVKGVVSPSSGVMSPYAPMSR